MGKNLEFGDALKHIASLGEFLVRTKVTLIVEKSCGGEQCTKR